jgi:hypothetical protein
MFAARRLGAEGVLMLFAVRNDHASWFEAPGLQQRTLAPLSEPAPRQVVASSRGTTMQKLGVKDRRDSLDRAAGITIATRLR